MTRPKFLGPAGEKSRQVNHLTATGSCGLCLRGDGLDEFEGPVLLVRRGGRHRESGLLLGRALPPADVADDRGQIEDYHVLDGTGPAGWAQRANPEADGARSHAETDTTSPLQFFDLRVANGCEEESVDEFPPG